MLTTSAKTTGYAALEGKPEYEAIKSVQRERVAKFFADTAAPGRVLTLPGSWWSFETVLDRVTDNAMTYFGVEREWDVLHNSLSAMPGSQGTLKRTTALVAAKRRVQGFETDRAKTVHCELLEFITTNQRLGEPSFRAWMLENAGFSAGWLDFCSQLCAKTMKMVYEFANVVNPDAESVPLAVTVSVGREPPSLAGKLSEMQSRDMVSYEDARAKLFADVMARHPSRRLVLGDRWTYLNGNGTRMCVVTGTLVRKRR